MESREYPKNEKSILSAFSIGVGLSLAVMLIGVIAITLMITNEIIAESAAGYCVLIFTFISIAAGCSGAILLAKRKLMVVTLCTAITIALVLISITAMFFDGQYSGVPVTLLIIIGGAISTLLIVGRSVSRPKSYRRRGKL